MYKQSYNVSFKKPPTGDNITFDFCVKCGEKKNTVASVSTDFMSINLKDYVTICDSCLQRYMPLFVSMSMVYLKSLFCEGSYKALSKRNDKWRQSLQ